MLNQSVNHESGGVDRPKKTSPSFGGDRTSSDVNQVSDFGGRSVSENNSPILSNPSSGD